MTKKNALKRYDKKSRDKKMMQAKLSAEHPTLKKWLRLRGRKPVIQKFYAKNSTWVSDDKKSDRK